MFLAFSSSSQHVFVLQEAALAAKYTEVNAVNKQRLQNLEFAQSLLRQVSDQVMLKGHGLDPRTPMNDTHGALLIQAKLGTSLAGVLFP